MVATVVGSITPELVTDAAAIDAASVAFLTKTVGWEGKIILLCFAKMVSILELRYIMCYFKMIN